MRSFFFSAAIMVLAVFSPAYSLLKPGDSAPDFCLRDVLNDRYCLEDFQGGVVIICFWKSTCSDALRELRYLQDFQEKYGRDGLRVIGINVGQDRDVVEHFQNLYQDILMLMDEHGRVWGWYYQGNAYPLTYVMDQEGTIDFICLEDDCGETVLEERVGSLLYDVTIRLMPEGKIFHRGDELVYVERLINWDDVEWNVDLTTEITCPGGRLYSLGDPDNITIAPADTLYRKFNVTIPFLHAPAGTYDYSTEVRADGTPMDSSHFTFSIIDE